MRRTLVLAFALTACTVQSPPRDTGVLPTAQRAELLAFRDSVWHAWFAGDTTFLMRALPAEFISIPFGSDTVWANRAQTIAASQGFAASGGKLVKLEFPRNELVTNGSTTVVLTQFVLELEVNGQRSSTTGRGTEVFTRVDGRWMHPAWHLDSGR